MITLHHNKSGLRRVRDCVGELAPRFEMVASFYVCQPNHSYSHFMFSYTVILHACHCGCRCTAVLHCVRSELPHQGSTLQYYSYVCGHTIFIRSCSICLVSTTCCDATITKHKRNSNINIQELRAPLNPLLIIIIKYFMASAYFEL